MERFELFFKKVQAWIDKLKHIENPKLSRRNKNRHNYSEIHYSTIFDGTESINTAFHYDELRLYYRQLHYECIDTLMINISEIFNQNTIRLLTEIENYFMFVLNDSSALHEQKYEENLGLSGLTHFSDNVELQRLKVEFMNIHYFFKNKLPEN